MISWTRLSQRLKNKSRCDGMYVLKDPWGKTVGKYKVFKHLLKKGYELYDGQYSSYKIYVVGGSYSTLVGEIRYDSNGTYFRYAGKDYVIWADGSTNWSISDPDPYSLLDSNKIKRVRSMRRNLHKSASPMDEINKAFAESKKKIKL